MPIQDDDPLGFIQINKSCSHVKINGRRSEGQIKRVALNDWHTLSMSQGEMITTYARRTIVRK